MKLTARTKAELEAYLTALGPGWDRLPMAGALNAYKCNTCGMCIVTIDMDKGVTPSHMGCKATKNCDGAMVSSGYPNTPMPASLESCAVWEWYRPEAGPLGLFHEDQMVDEYVRQGGLMLRRRE